MQQRTKNSKYQQLAFELPLPAGLFGETCVIAVATEAFQFNFKGEFYVLTQRPTPALRYGTFKFTATDIPEELLKVDLDFVLDEAKRRAADHLLDRLFARSDELGRPDLQALNVRLVECHSRPLIGYWLRGQFQDQIREIASLTECTQLGAYLDAVIKIPPFDFS